MLRWLVVMVALSSEAWGFCTPTVQQLAQPIRRSKAKRVVSWYRPTASEAEREKVAVAKAKAREIAQAKLVAEQEHAVVAEREKATAAEAKAREIAQAKLAAEKDTPAPTPAPAPAPAPYLAPSPVAKKAPAPPTEAERSKAARMAAVAKVLAETTIPRVGVRPYRRAWSGSPYGLHTPPIPKKSYKSLFDPERPFWARRIHASRECDREIARDRAAEKAKDELLEAAWLRQVEDRRLNAVGSSPPVRLISRAVTLIDTWVINRLTASRKNKKTFIQTYLCE